MGIGDLGIGDWARTRTRKHILLKIESSKKLISNVNLLLIYT
jgi:hypothetical protein